MTVYPPLIKAGAAEVYLSGTVICRPGQIVEITPVPAASLPYRIQLAFFDNGLAPSGVEAVNQPDNVVLVKFTNFGTNTASTSAPVYVGSVSGMALTLDVAGYTTGFGASLVRVVTFTVLKGAP